jgi:hypothetical protein
MRAIHRAAIVFALMGSVAAAASPAARDQLVTVTGCVERDAATSVPIYTLVVPQPEGGSTIYQLNAPGNTAVPSAVGKMARVSGVPTSEKRAGREIRVISVKTIDVVAETCPKGAVEVAR